MCTVFNPPECGPYSDSCGHPLDAGGCSTGSCQNGVCPPPCQCAYGCDPYGGCYPPPCTCPNGCYSDGSCVPGGCGACGACGSGCGSDFDLGAERALF